MKTKIKKIIIITVILSLLPIFLGQDECEIPGGFFLGLTAPFKNEMINKIKKFPDSSKPVRLNVSFFPLAHVKNVDSETGMMDNINYLAVDVLKNILVIYNEIDWEFKHENKTWKTAVNLALYENRQDTRKIINILDSGLNKSERVKKIVDGFMSRTEPVTDILVTGRCSYDLSGDKIMVEMVALFKNCGLMETRKAEFQKEELLKAFKYFLSQRLFMENKNVSEVFKEIEQHKGENKVLAEFYGIILSFFTDSFERMDITQPTSDLDFKNKGTTDDKEWEIKPNNLDAWAKMKSESPPISETLYITNLSFMDVYTQSTMAQTEAAALLDEAVRDGMKKAHESNKNLRINEPGHSIRNSDYNGNQLINMIFNPAFTKTDRITMVVNDMMIPGRVDVIVTGQYIDDAKNPLISIRPLLIIKEGNRIITKNLQFKKDELLCLDPAGNKMILCKGAYEQISQAVQELLEQL